MITKEIWAQKVPLSQPSDSSVKWMLEGVGSGGKGAPPRMTRVRGHQIRRITTITVVICMIRSALVLDSGTPLMFDHQKYTVTTTLKNTANELGLVLQVWCSAAENSFSRPPDTAPR